ncbi:MAG: hypothetical protein KDK37_00675 [Leptospiraceae bacterium]|nr:hypothetical protein [Leptospiraceae bacterium]
MKRSNSPDKLSSNAAGIFGAVLVWLLFSGPLLADTIILRSGQEIDGHILNQSETSISIRTTNGNQTIPKSSIQRVLYGDAYRQQQDALKKKREEEKRRKEEEEKRKAEEERKKQEEELKRAQEEASRKAEEARLAEEQRKKEEAQKTAEQKKADRLARNAPLAWIFAGSAELDLLPLLLQSRFALINAFNGDLKTSVQASEPSAGVVGLGMAFPIWDMLFLELEGSAAGYAPEYYVLEAGRDLSDFSVSHLKSGFGAGQFGRAIRSSGDVLIGYRTDLQEILGLAGQPWKSPEYAKIRLNPVLGYRSMQQDAIASSKQSGTSTNGPSLYLANEEASMFLRSKGPIWGFRVLYNPLEQWPLDLEIGLYKYRLYGDLAYDSERNVLYNNLGFLRDQSISHFRYRIEGKIVEIGAYYAVRESLDVFVKIHGESADYAVESIDSLRLNSVDPNQGNTNLQIALTSSVFAPILGVEEEVSALEFGMRWSF